MTPGVARRGHDSRAAHIGAGVLLVIFARPVCAGAGPPLVTDDPGTPGDGVWEINVATEFERRGDDRLATLPLLDVNYGIVERLQLKYEVPWVIASEGGGERRSGLGNSEVGLKWRFLDGGEDGFSASVYPQVEFNNPRSSSGRRGLAEEGTTWVLPLQIQRTVHAVDYNLEVGRTIGPGDDEWLLGVAASRGLGERFEWAGEVVGRTSARFSGSAVLGNVGMRASLASNLSLLASIGMEWSDDFEPAVDLQGYVALQFLID